MFVTHREHAGHDPGAAARPHGGHPARGLHRGGEAPDRQALPRAAPDRAQRPASARRSRFTDAGLRTIIADYTREAGRAQPRARDRRGVPQGRARRSPRATLERKVTVTEPRVRELLGRPRFLRRDAAGARASPASRPAWPGRRSAATCSSSRRPRCPAAGKPHADRPARRRDARVRAGGALLRARPRRRARARAARRLVRHARPAPARAGGRDPQGRPERRHHDGHRADVAAHGPPGARRRRDDRRDHADRPGAADRRPQGEGARRPARRASSA